MKCLIVDDEIICREMVAGMLEGMGDWQEAADGKTALAKFKEAHEAKAAFDLILLDIVMPEMDGHQTAKAIRALERELQVAGKVQIIMLTSLNSANDAMASFCDFQCAAYLVKPVTKDALVGALSKLGFRKKT